MRVASRPGLLLGFVLRVAFLSSVACGGAVPSAVGPSAPVASVAEKPAEDPPPEGPPVQVDCGDFTTCAIVEGGAVRCWGRDKAGELGDGGSGGDRTKSIIVRGVENATAIALASKFACALGSDKKVKCWGTGRIANDGRPLEHSRATPVLGVEGADELTASGAIACARSGTSVACWGADAATIGTPPAAAAFTQVAAGFTHACALDKKGTVTCWGTGDWSAPKGSFAKPASISGATYLAAGDRHACVVTKDKKVQCWGMNDAGQLGTKPDTELHKTPVTVPGVGNAVKLFAGESAMCALLGDGSARCWGANGAGELGLGKKSSDERPAKVASVPDVAGMCLATSHGCALTKGKSILCWGANGAGQLGDGTKEKKLEPARVSW
jgi:alpha-tubulin suppressor-like RCC1 family protein